MIDFKITGADKLANAIKSMPIELKKHGLNDALHKGAKPLYDRMVANCPVGVRDSKGNSLASRNHPAGNLKKSIRIIRGGDNYPTYWVKPVKGQGDPDGWYAKFVEYGHFVRAKGTKFGAKGRVKSSLKGQFVKPKGFGFIRKTYDSMDAQVKSIITAEIMHEVEQYMKQG